MEIDALGLDDRAGAGEHDGRRRLEEVEGLLRPHVVELLDVLAAGIACLVSRQPMQDGCRRHISGRRAPGNSPVVSADADHLAGSAETRGHSGKGTAEHLHDGGRGI